jgi:ABC-type Mn2+/Zn2+ transport system permease subunit
VPVWAVGTGVAWAVALAGLAAGQGEPADAEPVAAWAVVVGVAGFGCLALGLVGLVLLRRWGFLASALAAVVVLGVATAAAGDQRPFWKEGLQIASAAAAGAVSMVGWRRSHTL